MSFSICLIDDDLLEVNREPKMLSECQIETKLSQMHPDSRDEYYESKKNLHDFIKSIIGENELALFGYTNPKLYNANIGCHPAFDVVIYDWEYGATAGAIDPAAELTKLIDDSHCFVYIYSHMNDDIHKQQINAIKDKNPHRVDFLLKGDASSADTLKDKINMYRQNSFSAQFAKELRINASKSVEKILVKLAHLDIEKFHKMMGTDNEEKKKDIVEFIAEKFKNNMMEMDFLTEQNDDSVHTEDSNGQPPPISKTPTVSSIKELWHYRMYSTINDKRVRKGDIYKQNDNEYIMIMTPNCQLSKYHSKRKTLGVFNYIKLVTKEYCKDFLLEYIELQREAKLKGAIDYSKPGGSLINQIGKNDSSPFLLPVVQNINDSRLDLLLLPKMFSYEKCKTELAKDYLEKADLLVINYEYVTTLGEPFLSELTKEIYNKLQGNGVPDYTDDMQKEIKKLLDDSIFS